jgi:hypothetical protein
MNKYLFQANCDYSKTELSYIRSVEQASVTDRPGAERKFTFRIFEIWSLSLPGSIIEELVRISRFPDSDLKLVTRREILNGRTDEGVRIADNARHIIADSQVEGIVLKDIEHSEIRVSCASLIQMKTWISEQTQYFLIVNFERKLANNITLAPIGGGLKVVNPASIEQFAARPDQPGSSDLRMTIPVSKLQAFKDWFYSRVETEREISPINELEEELVRESQIIPIEIWRRIREHL